jgi:hypothetical protein
MSFARFVRPDQVASFHVIPNDLDEATLKENTAPDAQLALRGQVSSELETCGICDRATATVALQQTSALTG